MVLNLNPCTLLSLSLCCTFFGPLKPFSKYLRLSQILATHCGRKKTTANDSPKSFRSIFQISELTRTRNQIACEVVIHGFIQSIFLHICLKRVVLQNGMNLL